MYNLIEGIYDIMFRLDNDFFSNLTDDDIIVLERKIQLEKRIRVLNNFLTEGTIKFILDNYPVFLDKISLNSIKRSSNFYMQMGDFDYNSLLKWYPIFLDYDRAKVLLSCLKSDDLGVREIIEYLGKSVEKDILVADVISNSGSIKIMNDDEFVQENYKIIKEIDNDRTNNEGFNNFIDNNINKYSRVLGRLS